MDSHLLITSNAELEAFFEHWPQHGVVAFDSEFLRVKTYFPEPCLMQIAVDDRIALVDVIAIDEMTPLLDRLLDEEAELIMHSAYQDLELIAGLTSKRSAKLFDTQLAYAFLGHDPQISYANLVSAILNIDLPKSQARTNWKKRPLSDVQLRYAGNDVRYLRAIHEQLQTELAQRGIEHWFREDCERLAQTDFEPDVLQLLLRLSGRNALDDAAAGKAAALVQWREATAREKNRPRRWILADEAIVWLARHGDAFKDNTIEPPDEGWARPIETHRTQLILALHASEAFQQQAASVLQRSRLEHHQKLIKSMQQKVRAVAKSNGLEPALIASRRELGEFVMDPDKSTLASGWRHELIGQQLRAMI